MPYKTRQDRTIHPYPPRGDAGSARPDPGRAEKRKGAKMQATEDGRTESGDGAGVQESKRAKVRRCLLDPLGFRFRKEVPEEDRQKFLTRLCDDLGYMAPGRLAVMADMLRGHGQGAAKCFWPEHATFVGLAEVVEPRPIEELPALRSWFGSVEGPRAIRDGTLVETFDYISARKVPPYTPQARAMVAERAAQSRRRLTIIAERRAQGLPVAPEDAAWEGWYTDRHAACAAIVERERDGKGEAA